MIHVGSAPTFATVDDANGDLYVANTNSSNVSVIEGTTVLGSINVGSNPGYPAYDPQNGCVYVPNQGSDNVSVIEANGSVVTVAVGLGPEFATYDPADGLVYVPNSWGSYVNVLEGARLVTSIGVGPQPQRPTYDPGDGDIFVPAEGAGEVSVINGTTVVGWIDSALAPCCVAYDSENGYVYISDAWNNAVTVVNGDTPIATIHVGNNPASLAADPQDGYVYVGNRQDGTVSVINGVNLTATIPVGADPTEVAAYPPDGDIYVANFGSGNVSVIEGTHGAGSVLQESEPWWLGYDAWNGYMYVTDMGSDAVSAIRPGYRVTFTQVGLPIGVPWWVNVAGSIGGSSANASLQFGEANGTYSYTIATSDSTYRAPGGTFTVQGRAVEENVTFSRVTFPVTFAQSGLWPGTQWWVTIHGGLTEYSTTSNLSFRLPNGTYDYTVGTVNTIDAASAGAVTVEGSSVGIEVTFDRVSYPVTFEESGLSNGTRWSVSLGGELRASTGPSIAFTESNGSYPFVVQGVPGWQLPNYTGEIQVAGAPGAFRVAWERTYNLTFSEENLPPGTEWQVNLTGGPSALSRTSTLSFMEPAGTYYYNSSVVHGEYDPVQGSVSVGAPGAATTVTFVHESYGVTFQENGLPLGAAWGVGFEGETEATVGPITFPAVEDGTYLFSVAPAVGWSVQPAYGTVVVHGSPVTVSIAFALLPPPPSSHNGSSPAAPASPTTPGANAAMGGVVVVIIVSVGLGLATGSRGGKDPPVRTEGPTEPEWEEQP